MRYFQNWPQVISWTEVGNLRRPLPHLNNFPSHPLLIDFWGVFGFQSCLNRTFSLGYALISTKSVEGESAIYSNYLHFSWYHKFCNGLCKQPHIMVLHPSCFTVWTYLTILRASSNEQNNFCNVWIILVMFKHIYVII